MKKLNIINIKSILDIKYKIELFNKNNPTKTLLYAPISEYKLFKSGWQKYHKRIYYNDNVYWLHPKYLKALKNKNIKTLNDIGLRISNDKQKKYNINTFLLKKLPRNEHITFILEENDEFEIRNYVIDEIQEFLRKKGYNILNFKRLEEKIEPYYVISKTILEYLTF